MAYATQYKPMPRPPSKKHPTKIKTVHITISSKIFPPNWTSNRFPITCSASIHRKAQTKTIENTAKVKL